MRVLRRTALTRSSPSRATTLGTNGLASTNVALRSARVPPTVLGDLLKSRASSGMYLDAPEGVSAAAGGAGGPGRLRTGTPSGGRR